MQKKRPCVASETLRKLNWWSISLSAEHEVENSCVEAQFVPLLWPHDALKSFQDAERNRFKKKQFYSITYFSLVSLWISRVFLLITPQNMMGYHSGLNLWTGSLLCLTERCYKGGKTSINHTSVVFTVNLSRCMAWMSTLTSCVVGRGKFMRHQYSKVW